jgi:hypothetical protein
MWIVLGIIGLIAIIAIIFFNWQSITNFKIGLMMDKFTEVKTPWMEIDFTTAVKGETPAIVWNEQNKTSPSLAKYRINGIFNIKNVIFVYGCNYPEMQSINLSNNLKARLNNQQNDKADIYFEDKNEQAYIFRSTDDGTTFEKTSPGHGSVKNINTFNNVVYSEIYEQDTNKTLYYRSADLGKTWVPNDWKPSFAWSDGTMFIENEDRTNISMSQDNGKTWQPLSGTLKEFNDKTQSLLQLNENTLVGMNEKEEFLFLDLKTMKIEKKVFETPENKKIVGFAISNHQLGLELEEYTLPDQTEAPFESGGTQTSYYFPETKAYVNLPKQLPYHIYWDVKDNYIGGFMHYSPNGGYSAFGTIVHVYTLDRGKHWNYEILDKYNLMTATAYINGQLLFVASKDSAGGVFLTKGKIN